MKCDAVASNHKSAGCSTLLRLVAKFKVLILGSHNPDLLRVLHVEIVDNFSADESHFFEHLCKAILAAVSDMKSSTPWADFASWIKALAAVATLFLCEVLNKPVSRKSSEDADTEPPPPMFEGASCQGARSCIQGIGFISVQEHAGTGDLQPEFPCAFRQQYSVSVPTCQVNVGLFQLSKEIACDAAVRTPMLRQMKQGIGSEEHTLDKGVFSLSHNSEVCPKVATFPDSGGLRCTVTLCCELPA